MAKTNDTDLSEILQKVGSGEIQLPDFQRPWTWECSRIKRLLASLSLGYPMGAVMCLERGNPNLKFKYRPLEGVTGELKEPTQLVLDGQQRLTSSYQATHSPLPVKTYTEKKKELEVFFYFDIRKCLDPSVDREDAIEVVPASRIRLVNLGRDVDIDLCSAEKEYEQLMFPANAVFSDTLKTQWLLGLVGCATAPADKVELFTRFQNEILTPMATYKVPVMQLEKDTPRAAVCAIFENVNTGGVPLSVFELATASFAAEEFDLAQNWAQVCYPTLIAKGSSNPIMLFKDIDKTSFLTAVALYVRYQKYLQGQGAVSCKRKDVLELSCKEYQDAYPTVLKGFELARKFLIKYECIYQGKDIPYSQQIIPLAAILACVGESRFAKPEVRRIVSRWFWCGVLSEHYGSAAESKSAQDIVDVMDEIEGRKSLNRTVRGATFSASRLVDLTSRQSAAYKGIMALMYKAECRDFRGGEKMSLELFLDEIPDIHHIFPKDYCQKTFDTTLAPQAYYDSIVNKTPIDAKTNRAIGNDAPSVYVAKLLAKNPASLTKDMLLANLSSHGIDTDALLADDYPKHFRVRAKYILDLIEKAMDYKISDRSSETVIKEFGGPLV